MKHALIPLFALLALSACASLSETQCRGGDWRSIGFEDGAAGRQSSRIADHTEACAEYGIRPDAAAWEEGRQDGLQQYCLPARAWREGARGNRLSPVCPIELVNRLERQNARGLEYYDIGQSISRAESDIRDINRRLARMETGDPLYASLMAERSRLRLKILRLRAERTRYAL